MTEQYNPDNTPTAYIKSLAESHPDWENLKTMENSYKIQKELDIYIWVKNKHYHELTDSQKKTLKLEINNREKAIKRNYW